MKIDLPPETRETLEDFFAVLVGYQLDGRLMLFQGLCSHREMIGAINVVHSIIGWQRGVEIFNQVTDRPKIEGWKNRDGTPRGWKFKDCNEAYRELTRENHHCYYCDLIPKTE